MDALFPYTAYQNKDYLALQGILQYLEVPKGARVEVPPSTTYRGFLRMVEYADNWDVLCREDGFQQWVDELRAVKDDDEINLYHELSKMTNALVDAIEDGVRKGTIKNELNAAMMIEMGARSMGCEGTGFGTLAAGPGRSFAIHAFPGYTSEPFGTDGLSILDFGIVYEGYTSDVTMTFARKLNKAQEKLVANVEKAYTTAWDLLKNGAGEAGIPARNVALAVDAYFGKQKRKMPHGLGHGIGLQCHEAPFVRTAEENKWVLKPGMIFTLEPGLYDPQLGGARYENDVLLLKDSAEVLTKSRVVRL
jgi:Xaa-Pro dipeptidase